jgi:hypothetical protein
MGTGRSRSSFAEKASHMQAVLAQKDAKIASLQQHVAELQSVVDVHIKEAITKREELRVAVMKREDLKPCMLNVHFLLDPPLSVP